MERIIIFDFIKWLTKKFKRINFNGNFIALIPNILILIVIVNELVIIEWLPFHTLQELWLNHFQGSLKLDD
jgi:hypothetical protein